MASRAFFGVIQNLANAGIIFWPKTSVYLRDMNTRSFLTAYLPAQTQPAGSFSQAQAAFQAAQQLVEQARLVAGRSYLMAVDSAERLYRGAVGLPWFDGPWAGDLPVYREIGAGCAVRGSRGLFYPSENVGETLII
jgi:hypothetical protein